MGRGISNEDVQQTGVEEGAETTASGGTIGIEEGIGGEVDTTTRPTVSETVPVDVTTEVVGDTMNRPPGGIMDGVEGVTTTWGAAKGTEGERGVLLTTIAIGEVAMDSEGRGEGEAGVTFPLLLPPLTTPLPRLPLTHARPRAAPRVHLLARPSTVKGEEGIGTRVIL